MRGKATRATACLLVALAAVLAGPVTARGAITLEDYPHELISLDDRATVTWSEDVMGRMHYGRAPGLYADSTVVQAARELVVVPADEGMSAGIHYCVIGEVGGTDVSEEFILVVESPVFPTPTSPQNGSIINHPGAIFEWDPVEGVPYYHIVVSDAEISIEEEDGELKITGANVIWQAITSGTSIQYGGPDPSGHFDDTNGTSPPLMNGFDYNWLVFNNYGNDPLLSSVSGAGLSAFTVDVPVTIDQPGLTSPPDSVITAEDIVEFTWTEVEGAVGYLIYICENRTWGSGEASYHVWDCATQEPYAEVRLASFLAGGEYIWRVIALDGAGYGVASAKRTLEYATSTGTAHIETMQSGGAVLPNVMVEIEFLSGGVSVLPAITNGDGACNKKLVPGAYVFHAIKDGFVDTLAHVNVAPDETVEVPIEMRRTPSRVRGIVEDDLGHPVFDARLIASCGDEAVSTETDADGRFALALTAGTWTIHAEKNGYAPSEAIAVELIGGQYLELEDPLLLAGTPGMLRGSIQNGDGNPIAGASVFATGAQGSTETSTNPSGRFEVELAPGEWAVHAEKAGFDPSIQRTVSVPPGGATELDPPIALVPISSSILGRVTDGLNDIAGARVVAVPPSGDVVVTETNSFGEFVLLPPPATYVLRAQAAGSDESAHHQVSVESGESFTGVELTVESLDCLIAGNVTCGGESVPGATVRSSALQTTTGADGSFALTVRHGGHLLEVRKPGYVSGEPLFVAVMPGQTIEGLEMRLADGAGSITGRVSHDGAPVPDAQVTASSGQARIEVVTDDAGLYELLVDSGEWSVSAAKPGFAPSGELTVVIAQGQSASGVDVDLSPRCATLRGVVSDGRGTVSRASVVLYRDGETEPSYRTSTSSNGRYSLRIEPDENHVLVVRAERCGTRSIVIPALSDGATANRDIALPSYDGSVLGTVRDESTIPIAGARVVAAWGDSASAYTDCHGRFSMWLDEGLYDIRVEKPGYALSAFEDVEVISSMSTQVDPVVGNVFASLAGCVRDSLTAEPLEGVLVSAVGPEGSASAVTNADGVYAIDRIVPETAAVRFHKIGYRTREDTLDFPECLGVDLDVDLFGFVGTIGGHVTDSGTALPIAGASIRAKLGDDTASTAVTDSAGSFALTGLDPHQVYDVHASKADYYATSANPVIGVSTPATGTDFLMTGCDGRIDGLVSDAASADPLPGATVSASDGCGHFGSATTGLSGAFSIGGLVPAGTYTLTVDLHGYHETTLEGVEASGSDVEIDLQRNFALLAGTVTTQGGGVSVEDVEVVATNTSCGAESRLGVPEESGAFEIPDVPPANYLVTASAEGCIATPSQIVLTVNEGQTLSGLDFTIERAVVGRVEVTGPTTVETGGTVGYSGDVLAADGRLVETPVTWSLSPEAAGTINPESGLFVCNEDYIGEFTVAASEPGSGVSGSLPASSFATVNSLTEATFHDARGMTITIGAGAVTETKALYLAHESLPDVMQFGKSFVVEGPAFHLKPDGLCFASDHEPTLALPRPSPDSRAARWDGDSLAWEVLGGHSVGDRIEVEIGRLGKYVTLSSSRSLGISNVRVEPNPFSPYDAPVTISYDLTSDAARMPFVTVKIYNMASQLVRELVENEPQGKGRVEHAWDGRTDVDELARNGRYVVEILAEDASGEETVLTTAVLIK